MPTNSAAIPASSRGAGRSPLAMEATTPTAGTRKSAVLRLTSDSRPSRPSRPKHDPTPENSAPDQSPDSRKEEAEQDWEGDALIRTKHSPHTIPTRIAPTADPGLIR